MVHIHHFYLVRHHMQQSALAGVLLMQHINIALQGTCTADTPLRCVSARYDLATVVLEWYSKPAYQEGSSCLRRGGLNECNTSVKS